MSQTPAGWYVDAQGTTRWWDGMQWTEHTQPPVSAPMPASEPAEPVVSAEPAVSEEPDERTRIRPGFGPEGSTAAPTGPAEPSETPGAGGAAETPGREDVAAAPNMFTKPVQPDSSPIPPAPLAAPSAAPAAPPTMPPTGPPPTQPPLAGPPAGYPRAVPPGPPGAPGYATPAWPQTPGAVPPRPPRSGGIKPWMVITAGVVVLAAIVAVILVLVLSGGDDESSSTSASVADFCASMNGDVETNAQLEAMQAKMDDTGTPADMPANVHDAWEAFLKLDDVDGFKDISDQITTLSNYYDSTCH